MPTVIFAPHLQRHVPCPPQTVLAATLRDALRAAFATAPGLEHYVLDDQGHIRKHVAVFVNGEMITNRQDLSVALKVADEVMVVQALSGG
jgi:sulfur-carrier protein